MIDPFLGVFAALSIIRPVQAPPLTIGDFRLATASLPRAEDRVVASRPAPPVKRRPESLGVETTGRAAFVADVATGNMLYAKRAHDVLPIASLTKLATAMVVLDAKKNMDEPLVFTTEDFPNEGKDTFVVGDTLTRRDAMKALLVGSVNEAANLLARTTTDRESFVQAMNAKAKSLHLASPSFVEPTGLDADNRANAADVAALLTTAMSYPELRQIASLPQVAFQANSKKIVTVNSTNLLLTSFLNKQPLHIVGAKTGSLPQSGYNMAQMTSDGAGHEIVVVGLGSPNHFSRYQDVKAMTAWAFDTYQWE